MSLQLIERDITTKYNDTLYHYTLSTRLPSIMKDKYLRARSCYLGVTKPAVYFTTNPVCESTIRLRQYREYPSVPIQLKLEEFCLKHRLVDIITWEEFCAKGGYANSFIDSSEIRSLFHSRDEIDSYSTGGDLKKEWYLCLRDVRLSCFEPPKVLYKNEWTSIENLEAAIDDAKSKVRCVCTFGM
jgi:hypothetical protein